jgi:hypothetical protein
MDQLGHTDPTLTLRVYRHRMRRDEASKRALRELVGLNDWAAMGSSGAEGASTPIEPVSPRTSKNPAVAWLSQRARQDLNLRPFAPETSPPSPPRAEIILQISIILAIAQKPIAADLG